MIKLNRIKSLNWNDIRLRISFSVFARSNALRYVVSVNALLFTWLCNKRVNGCISDYMCTISRLPSLCICNLWLQLVLLSLVKKRLYVSEPNYEAIYNCLTKKNSSVRKIFGTYFKFLSKNSLFFSCSIKSIIKADGGNNFRWKTNIE